MQTLLLALLVSAAQAGASPPAAPQPAWKTYAECSAAHYADARVPDLKRTMPLKDQIMELGRRYSAEALSLRQTEAGVSKARAYAYTKSYIKERTRLLALRPRLDIKAVIDTCPALGE